MKIKETFISYSKTAGIVVTDFIWKFKIILVSVLIVLILHWNYRNILYKEIHETGKKCYDWNKTKLKNVSSGLSDILEDVYKPKIGKSIIFHEISCESDLSKKVSIRKACVIESAARQSPDIDVYVIFPAYTYYNDPKIHIKTLLSYSNVFFRNVNINNYLHGTILENWFKDGNFIEAKFAFSHVSDLLRFVSLYKYRGTYMDLDLIIKSNINKMLPNFIGASSSNTLSSDIINFSGDGLGRDMAAWCLSEFKESYDGCNSENYSTLVLARVLYGLCNNKHEISEMNRQNCHGFETYSSEYFNPVDLSDWNDLFDEKSLNNILKQVENSTTIKFWNNKSFNTSAKITDNIAIIQFAKKYCPKVFSVCKEFF